MEFATISMELSIIFIKSGVGRYFEKLGIYFPEDCF